MLDELHVRDYALVRDAHLAFSSGLTVLSGETGAGKTALVGAIKLLLGERGDVLAIRDGSSELLVEGLLVQGATEHVIRRRLNREGRSRCTLDDAMVTVGSLAEKIGPLIDLHGQHEHQSLLSTAIQLDYLDQFAGVPGAEALAAYQQVLSACEERKRELEGLKKAARTSAQTQDAARHILREMEATSPQPGEYESLEQQLPVLRNGESLAVASQAALEALRNEQGALNALADAQRQLAQQAGVDPRLDELSAQLESLSITGEDLAASLRAYRESVDFDPRALDEALSRLAALEGLRKRYGPRMEDVFAAWEQAADQLSLCEDLTGRIAAAEQQAALSEEQLLAAADVLVAVRAQAAAELATALSAALDDFAMQGASVEYASQALPRPSWSEKGSHRYELLYKPSEASQPRPLAKIASGGELSRLMLALKTLFRSNERPTTLIFDEVDAGIGGNTATAIALRLRLLAADNQVIVVTHLAQIAAVADKQLLVEKSTVDGVAITEIREVAGEERVAEIARMLSGRADEVALEHARTLLESGGAQ
ncbi:MAG: DNA repair protein RecN [Coriobacteriia bacterium]|nr:DNA repair protein RecN [Coriobacteriia bacterium]